LEKATFELVATNKKVIELAYSTSNRMAKITKKMPLPAE